MPRAKKRKETRDRFGSVIVKKIKRDGRTVTVYDARKRYTKPDGTTGEKFKRCESDSEARIALINFNNEIQSREAAALAPAPKHTFFELADYFDKEYITDPVFANGIQVSGYRQDLKHLRKILDEQRTFLGNVALESITSEDLRRYHVYISTRKIVTGKGKAKRTRLPAVSTVNERLSFLRRVLNIGINLRWLDESPFKRGGSGLIRRKNENRRNRMLTFDEEQRLLAVCTGRRAHLRLWILTSLDTSMRRGDLYKLRWKDVDLKERVIYIERREQDEHDLRSKTGVQSIIPMTARLHAELVAHRDLLRGVRPTHLVFGRHDIKRAFRTACTKAKIVDLQYKDLRSTASTRMLLAGNANALVRKITRHTDDDILIDHYTNVDIENARLIGAKLDEFNELGRQNARKAEPWGNAKGNDPDVINLDQTAEY